jgi:uncharacterized protein
MPALCSQQAEIGYWSLSVTGRQRNRGFISRCRSALFVMKSPLHGLGCFAAVRFPKHSSIAEYSGERISHAEAMQRMRGPDGKRISELGADCYIDGSVDGNETQYINHSCEPNADVFIIDRFMIVFARREIIAGEEITVDYLNSFEEDSTVCQCHAPSCRQRIDLMAA